MNKKNLWFLPAIALVIGMAFSSCGKDEEPSASDVVGTYAGTIEAYIPGFVNEEFEENFKVEQKNGKILLSVTLKVTVEAMSNAVVDLLIQDLELTNFTPASLSADGASFTGQVFKAANFTYDLPIPAQVGTGTIALQGRDYGFPDYPGFHGMQGNVTQGALSMNGFFGLDLKGTASGTIFGETALPVEISISGVKK
jgi:hypothetical protein